MNDIENEIALRAAVLETEEMAARLASIRGAIADFAKGRPQADAWEEIVRTALHDEDDADPANDPMPPHALADWVEAAIERARAAGRLEAIDALRPGNVTTAAELDALPIGTIFADIAIGGPAWEVVSGYTDGTEARYSSTGGVQRYESATFLVFQRGRPLTVLYTPSAEEETR